MNNEMKKLFQNADKYNVNPLDIVLELKHRKGSVVQIKANEQETELLDEFVSLDALEDIKDFCKNFIHKIDELKKPYIQTYSHYKYEINLNARGRYEYTIKNKENRYIEESQEYFDTKNDAIAEAIIHIDALESGETLDEYKAGR